MHLIVPLHEKAEYNHIVGKQEIFTPEDILIAVPDKKNSKRKAHGRFNDDGRQRDGQRMLTFGIQEVHSLRVVTKMQKKIYYDYFICLIKYHQLSEYTASITLPLCKYAKSQMQLQLI